MRPRKPYFSLYLCGTSILFLSAGIVLLCLWQLLYDYIVSSSMVLKPNSTTYSMWIKNPIPLTLKLFVFNWTNPNDIYNSSVKPKFVQLGPYTYDETKEKSNVTWNSNNTVTFTHLKKWYFNAQNSNGSLNDPFTSINPVALSAAYTARDWSYIMKKGFSGSLGTLVSAAYLTKPVGDVLFGGYDDPLMNIARTIPFLTRNNFPPIDKFGWFYGRNGSTSFDGTFNMDTGASGQLGQLHRWKYADHTPYYPDACGEFRNTSAGEFFPTNLKKDSTIKFFSPDLCRYVELEFDKEEIINGIVGYKYSAGDKLLDNGTKIPENRCFCFGDCMPSGALNVSACRYGSPAFVTLPHFFKADPYYLQLIEGLTPDEEKHNFFMTFEPQTGIPLQVSARLQLNLRMQPIKGVWLYENMPTLYFPVLWFEQFLTIPDSMAFNIKLLVNFKVICWAIGIILISVGVLIDICVFYKLCTSNLFGSRKPEKISREEVPLYQNKKTQQTESKEKSGVDPKESD